nr:PDR/VanB family oxidoreductase [Burkholderia ambifaria]
MQANRHQVRIDALIDAAQDIRCFRVSRVDGQPFDAYEPGAHIDVTAPSGVTRQYSLCGRPDERGSYLFAVKKEAQSRGGSRSLHDDVRVGAELSIGAPRNLFRLTDEASAEPFASHVTFHYGIDPDALAAELGRCVEAIDSKAHVYTCGPGPFMDAVVAAAATRIPEDAIHLERFAAEPAAADAAADAAPADGFEVRLQRSGQSVRVAPDTSIVDALAQIGIEVDTSCGEGVCGTCMVPVLDGEPDHRDHCLSKAERASNTVICCCVSRARSAVLVLDL